MKSFRIFSILFLTVFSGFSQSPNYNELQEATYYNSLKISKEDKALTPLLKINSVLDSGPYSNLLNSKTGRRISIPNSAFLITGDITFPNIYNALINHYASFSVTTSGASTILGNNTRAGVENNTIYRNISAADNGSYVKLNYQYGITFHTGVNTPLNEETSSFNFQKMQLTHHGNLGIGVSFPTEKLEVNGKVRAKEVKVEATGWPDYVFEPSYNKMSLPDLEKFIQQNKHLPEIPSAKDAEKNGIELGEMNKLLLKKIEELTLYIIEQNKRFDQLENKKRNKNR